MDTGKKLFGFPINFKDQTIDNLIFNQPTQNMNDHLELEVSKYDGDNPDDLEIKLSLNINFNRDVTEYHYKGYGDILTKLGGLKAILGPALGFITPFLMLYFLVKLSKIIQESYTYQY